MISSSPSLQIAHLLADMAERLQLTPTQFQEATERYQAVYKWLSSDEGLLGKSSTLVFPQGSLRIGTTVKPLGQAEYDLDIVCKMVMNRDLLSPTTLLDLIEKRLNANERYKGKIKRKSRCIQLQYANEFHMDIIPAVTDSAGNDRLWVPDRNAGRLVSSNPEGYAIKFEEACQRRVAQDEAIQLAARMDPIPDAEDASKKAVLKIAVQLLKRNRDIYRKQVKDFVPKSIVITTLAAKHYGGEQDVMTALMRILYRMKTEIERLPTGSVLEVFNPADTAENFTENWKNEKVRAENFKKWVDKLYADLLDLSHLKWTQACERLKQSFGEDLVIGAIEKQANQVNTLRESKNICVNQATGAIVGAASIPAVPIRANTFHGK